MVSDASKKGIGVVKTIKSVADELVMYEKSRSYNKSYS